VTTEALLPTYAREPLEIVSGDGVHVVDSEGRRYLDFTAGIAVADLVAACRAHGLLVLSAGANVLRLTPPLTVSGADVNRAPAVLADALL